MSSDDNPTQASPRPGTPERDSDTVASPGREQLAVDPSWAVGADARYVSPTAGVETRLGAGGMGVVLLVRDLRLEREVALKEFVPPPGMKLDLSGEVLPAFAVRFLREARITARLEHPNIVPVYDLGRHPNGTPYYVMKRIQGRNLANALDENKALAQRLPFLNAIIDACNAIGHAHHKGVVHRDLKSENIMLGNSGETLVVDWGLARIQGEAEAEIGVVPLSSTDPLKTQFGLVMGTMGYLAPELLQGEAATPRSDVYALGVVLFELLTGTLPLSHDTRPSTLRNEMGYISLPPVLSVVPGAPPELSAIAERALDPSPAKRYPDAGKMAEDLEAFRTGRLVQAHTYSPWGLAKRFATRHRATLTVVALGLCADAALTASGAYKITQDRNLARSERDRADQFAKAMVENLHERVVGLPGSNPALADLVEKARRYDRTLHFDQDSLERDDIRRQADSEIAVGEIALRLGMGSAAAEEYADAVRLLGALVSHNRKPRDVGRLIQALIGLGEAAVALGDPAGGMDQLGTARELAEQELARDHMPAQTIEVSDLLQRLGAAALLRGLGDPAEHLLTQSLEQATTLINSGPEEVRDQARQQAATVELGLGNLAWHRGNLPEAWKHALHALELDSSRSSTPEVESTRVRDLLVLARVARDTGDLQGAEDRLRQAAEKVSKLTAREPNRLEWALQDIAVGEALGALLVDRQPDQARTWFDRDVLLAGKLFGQDNDNLDVIEAVSQAALRVDQTPERRLQVLELLRTKAPEDLGVQVQWLAWAAVSGKKDPVRAAAGDLLDRTEALPGLHLAALFSWALVERMEGSHEGLKKVAARILPADRTAALRVDIEPVIWRGRHDPRLREMLASLPGPNPRASELVELLDQWAR